MFKNSWLDNCFFLKSDSIRYCLSALWLPIWFAVSLFITGHVFADYKDDIGSAALTAELYTQGLPIPTGAGVRATQVEALLNDAFLPNNAHAQLLDDNIFDHSGIYSGTSSHATDVGCLFYGSNAIGYGISDVDVYWANHWLGTGFLNYGLYCYDNPIQPAFSADNCINFESWELAPLGRVSNHSWAGSSSLAGDLLRRLDFTAAVDQTVIITAVNNGSTLMSLPAGGYNTVSVGRTDGDHPGGTYAVDALYDDDRTCPLLVVPMIKTSYAAPVVAAAAAQLIEFGEGTPALSDDPQSDTVTDRDSHVFYNATSATVIKSVLLAGAMRVTANSTGNDIIDYRSDPANRSTNGLDTRYGAGQLNVYNSYYIINGGEQNSVEDDPACSGAIYNQGFDYDPAFGGADDSNDESNYFFTSPPGQFHLYASLVWHLDISGGTVIDFNQTATRYDLGLILTDVTVPESPIQVSISDSSVENTENVWVPLAPGHDYKLSVMTSTATPFSHAYALAWRITAPPDYDGDGMSDDWEVQYDFDYQSPEDGLLDQDNDQLTNAQEADFGTYPDNGDSDGDGHSDGFEVAYSSDPMNSMDQPQLFSVPAHSPYILILSAVLLFFIGRRCLPEKC